MSSLLEKFKTFAKSNPKLAKILIAFAVLYVLQKLRNRYKYSQKQFNSPNEINKRAVLITGCDTGFGYSTANRLHSMGFCVIATVLRKESCDKFNKTFNNINNSISFVMDITKIDNICTVRNKVKQHLESNNKQLWAIVNNAGLATLGTFEMHIPKYMNLYTNVLLIGHLNVTREFMTLIEGRKNYVKSSTLDLKNLQKANGGRIINIASASVHLPSNIWILYGSLKSAMTYFSHALRYELSPRFGIYCCAIEPGGYNTMIWQSDERYEKMKNDIDKEVWDIYEMDYYLGKEKESKIRETIHQSWDDVVDCIVHALTAKYPNKMYRPGWGKLVKILTMLPMDTVNRLINAGRDK